MVACLNCFCLIRTNTTQLKKKIGKDNITKYINIMKFRYIRLEGDIIDLVEATLCFTPVSYPVCPRFTCPARKRTKQH